MSIGFIGCGNMAGAIIGGIIKSGAIPADEIKVFDIFYPAVENAVKKFGVGVCESERDIVKSCDTVILAVGGHSGYGSAKRIYVKRGYNFDGSGVWYRGKQLGQYEPCVNDDDLLLFMYKKLR